MSDDFFNKIDKQLDSSKAKKEAAQATQTDRLKFAAQVISQCAPVAEQYQQKLHERGVKVEYSAFPHRLTFKILYKDGGFHGLTFGADRDSSRLTFEGIFTDEGKSWTSTSGGGYDEKSWKAEIFEQKLQKEIEDALFYADRHHGVATP
jgi:hypothetical protein